MEKIKRKWKTISFIFLFKILSKSWAQNYEVYNIRCHDNNSPGGAEVLTAILKRPEGFRGHPIFADNRHIKSAVDEECQIREDKTNPNNIVYRLKIADYARCPVDRKDEFVMVRIWFPQIDGIVMVDDQDVILRCKPPLAIITEHKSTAFSGSMPPTGRVSGVVEGNPGELEYNIGLYQESTPRSNNFDLNVDDIVPIGTMIQLRASINNKAAWKYVKLLEVTVSENPEDPHAKGHITLVKSGCRVKEYDTIVPHQPKRPSDNTAEVTIDFQAFLLDNMATSGKLWIHAQIKACLEATDCLAEFCLDLFQPSGHGRKKRTVENIASAIREERNKTNSTSIDDNIGITVVIPGMEKTLKKHEDIGSCTSFLALTGILGILCFLSSSLAGILYRHIQKLRIEFKLLHPIYSNNSSVVNKKNFTPVKEISRESTKNEIKPMKGLYRKFTPHHNNKY